MKSKSLVSIDQCSKEDILRILDNARKFEENPNRKLLEGKVAATLFFEPSTRTRLSFETAVNRLGGRVIGFSDASTTSSSKGETLKDTILMVSNYVDLIIMRHHLEGAARYASEVTDVPIINAGDGANQHPSQTMLDLYSIRKTQGKLDNLTITMVGDLTTRVTKSGCSRRLRNSSRAMWPGIDVLSSTLGQYSIAHSPGWRISHSRASATCFGLLLTWRDWERIDPFMRVSRGISAIRRCDRFSASTPC